jgi:hypothetical protein
VLLGNNEIFKPDVACIMTAVIWTVLATCSLPYWPISIADIEEFTYKMVREESVLFNDAVIL